MTNSLVTDQTIRFLDKTLGVASKRHGLISANVANIDTVGYKSKDIDFKKTLMEVLDGDKSGKLDQTHPKHFLRGTPLDGTGACRDGVVVTGDAVDIDQEMTQLAENNIVYRTNLEMLLRKMSIMRTAVIEGGK